MGREFQSCRHDSVKSPTFSSMINQLLRLPRNWASTVVSSVWGKKNGVRHDTLMRRAPTRSELQAENRMREARLQIGSDEMAMSEILENSWNFYRWAGCMGAGGGEWGERGEQGVPSEREGKEKEKRRKRERERERKKEDEKGWEGIRRDKRGWVGVRWIRWLEAKDEYKNYRRPPFNKTQRTQWKWIDTLENSVKEWNAPRQDSVARTWSNFTMHPIFTWSIVQTVH